MTSRLAAWLALLAAAVVLFLFQYPNPGLLPGHHGYNTSLGMALAANLGWEHRFLMFSRKSLDPEGRERLDPHNRLPILSFALIGAAIAPFRGDVIAQLGAARALMNLFLAGALAVSYLLLLEVSGRPIPAAAASLAAFSSFYLLYYNDMVYNDVPALFGFLLLLLGIARWELEGTKGLLASGVLLGLGLGWQAFGALGAWWTLDLARELKRARMGAREAIRAIPRRPATRALLAAAAWGALLLGSNLLNEWRATGGEFSNLPSVRSIRFRAGLAGEAEGTPDYAELQWGRFLVKQARRVMKATVPAGSVHGVVSRLGDVAGSRLILVAGAAAILALLLGAMLWRARNRLLLGTILLSGLFWTIPLRNFSAFHEYQSLFYAGIALVFYLLILTRLPGKVLPAAALAAALALFTWSAFALNAEKAREAEPFDARTVDFASIRKTAGEGRRIQLGVTPEEFAVEAKALRFFMAGETYAGPTDAELLITRRRAYGPDPLTPGNREVFLFRNR